MKEFWIFISGTKYVEYAEDINELFGIYGDNATIVEAATKESNLSIEEDSYYENYYKNNIEEKDTTESKLDKVLGCSAVLNSWERNFVYGLKSLYNKKHFLSDKQIGLLDKIVVKYVA